MYSYKIKKIFRNTLSHFKEKQEPIQSITEYINYFGLRFSPP